MNEQFTHLLSRAEELITRIESVLPQALSAPDWAAAVAYRYRKRSSGHGALEPIRHIGAMRLSDLKEIGCKSAWPVHISPISWAIERLLPGETVKICPRPAGFSLRFFKSDRLLAQQLPVFPCVVESDLGPALLRQL